MKQQEYCYSRECKDLAFSWINAPIHTMSLYMKQIQKLDIIQKEVKTGEWLRLKGLKGKDRIRDEL